MRLLLLAPLALALHAQGDAELGARVFRQTCSVGYCHGSGGGAGRAPVLAGRGLAQSYLAQTVADGIPNTGMPGFKSRLSPAEYNAVMAYLLKINGPAAPGPIFEPVKDAASAPSMPPAARRGKDLFFDPVRGTRCGTCHTAESWGQAVGPILATPSPSLAAMRNGKGGQVQTARAGGESFPAVLVESRSGLTRVFDLTTPLPVLRTFPAREIRFSGNSAWKHADFVNSYSDADLQAIGDYLKWLAER
jgi:mono/diheme cytochrome c family protein